MGMFSWCPNCGSDYCVSCECCRISPENLRKLANVLPNSGHVGALRGLADYFERDPKMFNAAMKKQEKP